MSIDGARRWFSFWKGPSGFVFHILPSVQLTALPRDGKMSDAIPDWRYSVSVSWLFYSITFVFGRYALS